MRPLCSWGQANRSPLLASALSPSEERCGRNASLPSLIATRPEQNSQRIIWPFALGFFDRVRVVVAWCELRDGFRHFRADRIASLAAVDICYPRRRQALLKDWRDAEGISSAW